MASEFHQILLDCAKAEGFPLVGALDLDLGRAAMLPHVARYDRWLQAGHAGAMQYLERGRDRRADPNRVMPEAKSILCVALPYPKRAGGALLPSDGPRYARYIHGRDYHEEISDKLERVMQAVKLQWAAAATQTESLSASHRGDGRHDSLRWKVCVDTSAVLERSWATLAGLGWIGKNTLLIHPQLGSYLFLGEVLINQATGQGPAPLKDYCGSCTRCLDSCPTQAFKEARFLDSNRCISYWTLEKRGAVTLPEADKKAIGSWVAGCDICQEVCPFNLKPAKKEASAETVHPHMSAEYLKDWEALLTEKADDYKKRVAESALSRVKPAQFSRNLALALANAPLTPAQARPILALTQERLKLENDESARTEWQRCLVELTRRSENNEPIS